MATDTAVTFVKDYERIHSALNAETPRYRRIIETAYDRAVGYAWGRIDAPGVPWPAHGGDALDFGTAYAIHNMTPGGVQALREAYNEWYAKGVIS